MSQATGDASLGLQGCLETCRRCENLVRLFVGTDGDRHLFGVIGPHMRHCLDYYRCLLKGLETGTIDYDDRERDVLLENEPEIFLGALHQVTAEMAGLAGFSTTLPVDVIQIAAPNSAPVSVGSTLERELLFLSSHTINHLALAVEIAAGRGVCVPTDLGVAFSTAAFIEGLEIATN